MTAAYGAVEQLQPDLGDARRFLELLDPDAEEFVFQTFDDTPLKSRSLAKTWRGALDVMAAPLARLQEGGAGVFVAVNACAAGRRRAEDVTRVRSSFLDLDGEPLNPVLACELEPHVVVESSPGKFHAYWIVEGVPLDRFTPVQKAIAARFGGDKSVSDLLRVMRLPGFWHQKGEPFRSRIFQVNERLPYHVSELLAEFPPVEATMVASSWRGWKLPAGGMLDAGPALHWFSRLPGHRQDEELERMLGFLTDDAFGEYETWIRITAGLWRADCPDEIWDAWCQQLPGYNAEQNAYKWSHGFGHVPSPATIGTVIYLARQRGYQPPPDVWLAASPLAGIARLYSPEEIAGLEARFRAGLAKRGLRS